MKQVLCFFFLLIGTVSYGQLPVAADSLLTKSSRSTNRLILERYCNEPYVYRVDTAAINLYQQNADLRLSPLSNTGYSYPANHKLILDPAIGRGSGLLFGPANANMYNPYGSTSLPGALFNGTVNYLLKSKHK